LRERERELEGAQGIGILRELEGAQGRGSRHTNKEL
jgi:hypothetical protein